MVIFSASPTTEINSTGTKLPMCLQRITLKNISNLGCSRNIQSIWDTLPSPFSNNGNLIGFYSPGCKKILYSVI